MNLVICFFVVAIKSAAADDKLVKSRRKFCSKAAKMHHVKPGMNWGSLNVVLQKKWIQFNCDEFFCESHHLAGKGIYKCVPRLVEAMTMQNHTEII